jgi:hypothetical protein
MMYLIEAAWEVGHRGPIHAFYVNDKRAGTRVEQVAKLIQGPPRKMIAAACADAKWEGRAVALKPSMMGWVSGVVK